MKLPPLPSATHPTHSLGPLWSVEQMQSFGRAAQRIALEEAIEAVDDAGGDNTEYHKDAIRRMIEDCK